MKFIKKFNESVRPYSYLQDNSLFKYILMIDRFDMDKDNFDKDEKEECKELIQSWIYNFTSNLVSGIFTTPVSIELNLDKNFVFYLSKYVDDYYLIKAALQIRGNRVPICVVVDSIDGLRMWSKTNPLEFIEEWGSLKENLSFDWYYIINQKEWLKRYKDKLTFNTSERLEINKHMVDSGTFIEFDKEYNSEEFNLISFKKYGERGIARLKLARVYKSTDEWYLVDIAGQNWINLKCDGMEGLIFTLNKISTIWKETKSLHKIVNELDPSTIVTESINNLEDQFFKKIKFGEYFDYRKNKKQEPLDKSEISKIVETLEGWHKKLMRFDDPTMLLYRKIGPRSNEIFITKLEDEWFSVQHTATEPQNWRNRRTGRTTLVETQTVEDYYICDQLDGLIYLLNKLNN